MSFFSDEQLSDSRIFLNRNTFRHRSLRGLGYAGSVKKGISKRGIVTHRPSRVAEGLTLYVSGHAPAAYLIDREGNLLHRWHCSWEEVFPDQNPGQSGVKKSGEDAARQSRYWRNVHLLPNGDLIAIFSDLGMVRIDRNSEVIWSKLNHAHHDLDVRNGKIYVLTRQIVQANISDEATDVVDDRITMMNLKGEVLAEYSILRALLSSKYSGVLDYLRDERDLLHTNTLRVLNDTQARVLPTIEAGNFLVSMNKANIIGVIDHRQKQLKWVLSGMTRTQHDPNILSDGRILLLDNGKPDGPSRVLKIDPATQVIDWKYQGDGREDFFTKCCGTNQQLPNGNVLITETDDGRAIEVTPRKEVVWEFYNPHRMESDKRAIPRIFEMRWYPREYVNDWLTKSGSRETSKTLTTRVETD